MLDFEDVYLDFVFEGSVDEGDVYIGANSIDNDGNLKMLDFVDFEDVYLDFVFEGSADDGLLRSTNTYLSSPGKWQIP